MSLERLHLTLFALTIWGACRDNNVSLVNFCYIAFAFKYSKSLRLHSRHPLNGGAN